MSAVERPTRSRLSQSGHGNPYRPSPWVKTVISPQGRRNTLIVAFIRLMATLLTAIPLAFSGMALGRYASGATISSSYWYVSLLCILGAAILGFCAHIVGGVAALSEERSIRRRLLERIFAAAFLPRSHSGEFAPARLIQLMSDNAERATEYRQRFSGVAYAALATPFLILAGIAIFFDPVTGFIIMALCPIIPISFVAFLFLFRKTSARSRQERARLSGKYLDAIRNLVTIRLYGAGARIEQDLRTAGEKNRGAIMKLLAGNQLVIVVVDGVFSLVLIVCSVLVVIWRYQVGALDVGQSIAVVFLSVLLIEPLAHVAGFFYIGMGGKAALRAIGSYMSAEKTAERHDVADTGSDECALQSAHAISLRQLSYDYGDGLVLDNINLDIDYGEKIGIVGRSGGGKSTLVSLIRGSLPLQSGTMCIDGHNAALMRAKDIRELSASVSQRTWMFTGTIADNLRLAKKDASDEEMWQALRGAHVAEEIERMPQGLETYIGEGAQLISGGQAQRISIARAILSGRKILLLDEPTSHVDMESESHIIDALGELGKEWTVLIVTHRHSLLAAVDKTYTMREGKLERAHMEALVGEGE